MTTEQNKVKPTLRGEVVSDAMDKTIGVLVKRRVRDPLYKKVLSRSTKLLVHDADNQAKKGDFVEIQETRPLSKRKAWVLVKIVRALCLS